MFINMKKNPDGSHAFQIGGQQEDGWAYLPSELQLPDTFPFVNIEVAEVTRPAITSSIHMVVDGEEVEETVILVPEITRIEVVSITEGEKIPVEVPHIPTAAERIAALEEENSMLLECILEMSEIIYA